MESLESRIGYSFKDKGLLRDALTHSSYFNENRSASHESNERLEFLGDAVLGLIVGEYLFRRFPQLPEGRLTRLRAELVCEKSLDGVARLIGLGEHLLLGRGEASSGGRTRPSINADAVEALIAALYLDGGFDEPVKFIRRFILGPFESGESVRDRDAKSELQELVQRKSGQFLEYILVGESGPDHMKEFTVEVCLNGEPLARASGRSKKDAEQHAALSALEKLR